MGQLILRRLLGLIPLLLLVSFLVFALGALLPGDPAVELAGGLNATPEKIREVRTLLRLDDPWIVQYGRWLGNALQLDLGKSLAPGNESVSDQIFLRLPVTMAIAFAAVFVTALLGTTIGVISGMKPGSSRDRAAVFGASVFQSIPNYLVAALLAYWFAVKFRVFQAVGFTRFTESQWGWFKSLVLPAFALGMATSAVMARQLRAALIDVMNSAYVRTAWAKGANPRRVVAKHALKNAAIPAVTVLGGQLTALLGGTLIVEGIFSIPGIGGYLFSAVTGKNLPVIQGVVLTFVTFQVLLNLAVDITYSFLNPKVRIS